MGLALGAMDDRLGQDLGLARTIGLALFAYTVGLSSGSILIRTFRRQLSLMAGSALVLVVVGWARSCWAACWSCPGLPGPGLRRGRQ